MRRRQRRLREIPFSFDSFLDIVANVVGIIIRLILVAWVGARSYSSVKDLAIHSSPSAAQAAATPELPKDSLEDELARHRRELADARKRLLDQLRQLDQAKEERVQVEQKLGKLAGRRQGLEEQEANLNQAAANGAKATQTAALSIAEIQDRQKRLLDELQALEKTPAAKKVLRYQTPVSRPVHSDEFMFECRAGRVTFIDIAALQSEIRRGLDDKGQFLRTRWQVNDVTSPVGAFRLRYTLERERGLVEAVLPGASPEASTHFRYGLTGWVVEPVAPNRGENLTEALAQGSDFRRLADTLDPQQSVVTFWIYPDSFALYRQLRDYLYERDLVVAGRPLPPQESIRCSRDGSLSRGQ